MNESLNDLRESIARVLQARCSSQALHAHIDRHVRHVRLDDSLWAEAAELGWLALGVSEECGGLGLGVAGLAILYREIGQYCAPGPFLPTLAAAQWLDEVDHWPGRADLTQSVVAGERRIAVPALFADEVLEETAGGFSGAVQVLGAADSDFLLLPATDGRWLLLPAQAAITSAPIDIWDRTRDVAAVTCSNATPLHVWRLPAIEGASRLLRHMALGVAEDSAGGAHGITMQTIEYLKARVQFGRPIGSFQALKHRVADIVAGNATQDFLIEQAIAEAAADDPAEMWAALAKASASDWYGAVAGDCIQLHGGIGHTWEYDVHIRVKRARLNQALVLGNAELRDRAAAALALAAVEDRSTMEIAA